MPRGRAQQPIETRVGIFIRDFLLENAEASVAELHRAYKERLGYFGRRPVQRTGKGTRFHAARYHPFQMIVYILRKSGVVEFSGREEAREETDKHPALAQKRFYRLTPLGRTIPDVQLLNVWGLYRGVVPAVISPEEFWERVRGQILPEFQRLIEEAKAG